MQLDVVAAVPAAPSFDGVVSCSTTRDNLAKLVK
jgi:hypothetical protein